MINLYQLFKHILSRELKRFNGKNIKILTASEFF